MAPRFLEILLVVLKAFLFLLFIVTSCSCEETRLFYWEERLITVSSRLRYPMFPGSLFSRFFIMKLSCQFSDSILEDNGGKQIDFGEVMFFEDIATGEWSMRLCF